MRHRRFDWHERVRAVENEYRAVRIAIDRLTTAVAQNPQALSGGPTPKHLRAGVENLEGTYLIRLFSEFESALRSYYRWRQNDPTLQTPSSVLIDSIGGRHGQAISRRVVQGAHEVRVVRNDLVHERDEPAPPMSIADARARLQTYLHELPEQWG
jgi:hypothetical protein